MTPTPARLRIALIGAGSMGSLHARVVTQSQDADLELIVDPDEQTGKELAARFQTEWAPTLDDFPAIDAVIVAAPTPMHIEFGMFALEADRPVLVEKPLADDLADVHRLVDRARERGVPLTCGLLERFNPAVRTALRIVDEPLHIATIRHSPHVARIQSGVTHDLLIHDADLALRIAGALPTSVSARLGRFHPKTAPEAEDVAEVILTFDPHLIAVLSVSWLSQRKVRSLVISELDRLVEVDMVRNDLTVYRHVGNAPLDDDGPGYRQQTIIDIPTIHDAREPLAVQLEHFVGLARGDQDATIELDSLVGPHAVVAEVRDSPKTGR